MPGCLPFWQHGFCSHLCFFCAVIAVTAQKTANDDEWMTRLLGGMQNATSTSEKKDHSDSMEGEAHDANDSGAATEHGPSSVDDTPSAPYDRQKHDHHATHDHQEGHGDMATEHVAKTHRHHTHHASYAEGEGEVGWTAALMLLGAVAFQMSLFYLVQNNDDDIRRYSWIVIGTTISIFSAVLLFEGMRGILETYILKWQPTSVRLLMNVLHGIFWFVSMQTFVLFMAAREKKIQMYELMPQRRTGSRELPLGITETTNAALGSALLSAASFGSGRDEVEITPVGQMVLTAKCWGSLFGHIAAFAGIRAFAELQIFAAETVGASGVYAAPFCVAGYFVVLILLAGYVRARIIGADERTDTVERVWEYVVLEIENDVCACAPPS
eukprot:gnl/MRDRNA2_/MRDRNA2_77284_c0_seq1.p1 gnl/MRDRNA2_/MRDRNA2_77284_c0~~gnl/MRDRNA2_/MRDRNA2_77284_c0_seq1.p1  ORF type:complete len:383 (-),score=67.66 gnl/MRDRNA2_/MRDRNA2_77284_c0_seq1:693-1841(-)